VVVGPDSRLGRKRLRTRFARQKKGGTWRRGKEKGRGREGGGMEDGIRKERRRRKRRNGLGNEVVKGGSGS